VIADNALCGENRAQRGFQRESGIGWQCRHGRRRLHRLGVIGDQLTRQLRIRQQVREVIPTWTQAHDGKC